MEKVVLTAAIMDCLHEGHINLLRKMREEGDCVIVVLHSDESCWRIKGKVPIQSVERRAECLMTTGLVDETYVTEDDPSYIFRQVYETFSRHSEVVFMRGDDNRFFPGWQTLNQLNVPIKFVPYTEGVSSTQIREGLV